MNEFKFFIPRRLPGLNEIIAASKKEIRYLRKGKHRVFEYTILKQDIEQSIINYIMLQSDGRAGRSMKFDLAKIDFLWIEPNRRRDPSNVCAGGRKFILDAMVKCGLLTNDNWLINEFSDRFIVEKVGAGVEVIIQEKNCR